eukprot:7383287-Prymnesium_polylepis.1
MNSLIRDAAKNPIADPTRASLTVMSQSCGTHGLCIDTQPNRDLGGADTFFAKCSSKFAVLKKNRRKSHASFM